MFEPLCTRVRILTACSRVTRKAADVMLKPIETDNPPAHLLLGRDAISLVRGKLELLKSEFDAWERMSGSTDFE